jgi:hypothetical protein
MATERGKRRKRRPKGGPDNPHQSRRFIEAAKALGVDEDGKAFQEAMKNMLKAKKPQYRERKGRPRAALCR